MYGTLEGRLEITSLQPPDSVCPPANSTLPSAGPICSVLFSVSTLRLFPLRNYRAPTRAGAAITHAITATVAVATGVPVAAGRFA